MIPGRWAPWMVGCLTVPVLWASVARTDETPPDSAPDVAGQVTDAVPGEAAVVDAADVDGKAGQAVESEAGNSVAGNSVAAAGQPVDFPRLDDRVVADSGIAFTLPTDKKQMGLPFSLSKLLLLVAAVVIWLRALHVCAPDVDDEQLEAEPRVAQVFGIGLCGILVALLIPAYVPAAVVLLAASVVPFWNYKRWRNRQQPAPSGPIQWKHLFRTPAATYSADRAETMELPSGQIIGTASSHIRLIPKSQASAAGSGPRTRGAQASPGYRTVLALIDDAVTNRATDLHINAKDHQVVIRQRIDGALSTVATLPSDLGGSVINVFKVMSDLNIADRRRSQDGSFRVEVNHRRLSLRVSSQATQTGEKLSIRILDPAKNFSTFAALGMTSSAQERLQASLSRSNGLILIVGDWIDGSVMSILAAAG
ncbi:MAG: ATPase, T2SS/T4P/T4SS family [Fuerstiella sp.]